MTKICVNAGHGWRYNQGACKNYYEGEQMLRLAFLVREKLREYGFDVTMTRDGASPEAVLEAEKAYTEKYLYPKDVYSLNNQMQSLKARAAKSRGHDLYLSLHSNAANASVQGVEVFDSTSDSNKKLATAIHDAIVDVLQTKGRGVKYRKNSKGQNYYADLRYSPAKSAMLVEVGFHSNPTECAKIVSKMDQIAQAIADTCALYYGVQSGKVDVAKSETTTPKKDPEAFIAFVAPLVRQHHARIFPSVTIAQACLESAFGTSGLAVDGKNIFGIKAKKEDWTGPVYIKGTKEYKPDGSEYSISASFREYDSWEASIIDHEAFFITPSWRAEYYAKVLEAKTPEAQCMALTGTYATDPLYGSQLINLIRQYDLTQYDPKPQTGYWTDKAGVIVYTPEAREWAFELSERLSLPVMDTRIRHDYKGKYGLIICVGEKEDAFTSYRTHYISMRDTDSAGRKDSIMASFYSMPYRYETKVGGSV